MSDQEKRASANPAYPSKIFLEVTTQCNLNCGMCVKQNTADFEEGTLARETFKALESALPSLNTLILNGIGEPLLHPLLEEFISRAKSLMPLWGQIGFQSNGMLLTEDRAASLLRAGLDRICLSMDAVSGDKFKRIRQGGDFSDIERAFETLDRVKRKSGGRRPDIGIEFVLMRDNLYELPSTLRWAARRGASFALVTQLLPYSKALAGQAAYDTNTDGAISIYSLWKEKAGKEGLSILNYFDIFLKYWKSKDEERIMHFVDEMKNAASSRNIALHLERLLRRDESFFSTVEDIFEEARSIAEEEGMEITLPEVAPKNKRKCEFVEAGSVFVSWDGNVHPCYFLWHRYACFVGGWDKYVKPWVFGTLADQDIIDVWKSPDFRSFREGVLKYDFPFCFDCGFALCDYVEGEEFKQDCYVRSVPCASCLWCTGLFHCLQ